MGGWVWLGRVRGTRVGTWKSTFGCPKTTCFDVERNSFVFVGIAFSRAMFLGLTMFRSFDAGRF